MFSNSGALLKLTYGVSFLCSLHVLSLSLVGSCLNDFRKGIIKLRDKR